MNLKIVDVDGKEIQEYEITLKTEVLLELIAGIKADLGRYMEAKNIDIEKDELDPLTIMYWDLIKMRKQLYKMDTMEEVMSIQNQSIYIRDFVKKIGA